MRKYLILPSLVLMALVASCSGGAYTIDGTVEDGAAVGDSIFLQYIDNGRIEVLGGEPVKGGSFNFKGEIETPRLCYLVSLVNGRPKSNAEIFVEPGDISVTIGAKRPHLSGTELNVSLQEYKDSIDILDHLFKQYYDKSKWENLSEKGAAEADKGMKVLSVVRKEYVQRFIEKNIDNLVSRYIISQNYETLDPNYGIDAISRMPVENKSDTLLKHIDRTFRNKIATAEGKMFTDFAAYTPEGKQVKFSDYVGKGGIVVLHVWSTTGRNTTSHVESIKTVVEACKDKATFIGFALDTKVPEWRNAIKEHGLSWSQISDLRGWGSKAIFSYGINSAPYNIVFASDGTILRRGISTEDLPSVLSGID